VFQKPETYNNSGSGFRGKKMLCASIVKKAYLSAKFQKHFLSNYKNCCVTLKSKDKNTFLDGG
jgi:hypothetical protein